MVDVSGSICMKNVVEKGNQLLIEYTNFLSRSISSASISLSSSSILLLISSNNI